MTHATIVPVLVPFTSAVVMIVLGERRLGQGQGGERGAGQAAEGTGEVHGHGWVESL